MKELIRLKELRLEYGYNGSYIANLVGICKSHYYHLETGKRALSYSLAIKIADVFKMKPDQIFYSDLS